MREEGGRILVVSIEEFHAIKGNQQVCFYKPVKWRKTVNKAEKSKFVAWLNKTFQESGSVVVAHYSGLTVSQMNDLRSKMNEAGGAIKVAKNRLAKIALQGTESEAMMDLFTGQTLIVYSEDPITASRVAVDFAKTNDKFVILGGSMGATSLSVDAMKSLASLPSLNELRAKILGMVSTPATRIAQIVNAPAGQVARVVGAYARGG
ncbi:50S ribosomal protein L10 [Bartonella clarridgeiae 73]|uniref:Large ribosomal subunit protein uL10 n=1 Tax=Bartonella clarridgeiae (strain CCUG 45776 / CIP 104772 / 73) TaxID=696125 RepID=E6YI89_BARC7|nr:MAG: LSU ribosomal protein L10p (P0) [Bartonella clarridgeiae]CBI76577.1 50S ribosomal protein L10 [Bartonella clarridgeiae 73]